MNGESEIDMQNQEPKKRVLPYRNLIAPIVMLAFALGWYQFSVVYIQGANLQLVLHNNLAVYVPVQQLQAYMEAVREFTIASISLSLIFFLYYFSKFVRIRMTS